MTFAATRQNQSKPKISLVKKPVVVDARGNAMAEAVKRCDTLKDDLTPREQGLITASKIMLPSDYLSPTQIEMFLRCPQQYKRRYIDGVKAPPGVALVEGSTHHVALETNNQYKIKKGADLKVAEVEEAFADTWSMKKKEIEDWEGEKPDDILKRGRGLIRSYMRDFAPLLQPRHAERTTCVPVGPVRVLGVIDVDGFIIPAGRKTKPGKGDKPTIADYKTVSQARSQRDVDNSLQLSFYAYAHGFDFNEHDVDVGLCSLVKSTGLTKWVPARATKERIRWFRYVALSVANAISLGNFPVASPDQWCCSPRFCGYWNSCRGAAEKNTPLTVKGASIRRK